MVNQLGCVNFNLPQLYHNTTQHFLDNPAFFTLGVAVPNTIKTAEFCLWHHIWLEIQNSIAIIHGYLWLFKILVNLNFFLLDSVLLA